MQKLENVYQIYDGLRFIDSSLKDIKSLNTSIITEILKKCINLIENSKYEHHISFSLEFIIKILKGSCSKEEKTPSKRNTFESISVDLMKSSRINKIKNDSQGKYSANLKSLVNNLYKLFPVKK